jgi:hypothetical protein
MTHTCVDGNGDKIEIALPRIAYLNPVEESGGSFGFTVHLQANQGMIIVTCFKSREDAETERNALEAASKTAANKPL